MQDDEPTDFHESEQPDKEWNFAASYAPTVSSMTDTLHNSEWMWPTASNNDDEEFVLVRSSNLPPVDLDQPTKQDIDLLMREISSAMWYEVPGGNNMHVLLTDAFQVTRFGLSPCRTVGWQDITLLREHTDSLRELYMQACQLANDFHQLPEPTETDTFVLHQHLRTIRVYVLNEREKLIDLVDTIPPGIPSDINMINPMHDRGLVWFRDVIKLFVKYKGLVPATAKQIMEHFRDCVDTIEDDDLSLLVHHIEYRLGNSSLEEISRNFHHWILSNFGSFPPALKMVVTLEEASMRRTYRLKPKAPRAPVEAL